MACAPLMVEAAMASAGVMFMARHASAIVICMIGRDVDAAASAIAAPRSISMRAGGNTPSRSNARQAQRGDGLRLRQQHVHRARLLPPRRSHRLLLSHRVAIASRRPGAQLHSPSKLRALAQNCAIRHNRISANSASLRRRTIGNSRSAASSGRPAATNVETKVKGSSRSAAWTRRIFRSRVISTAYCAGHPHAARPLPPRAAPELFKRAWR